MIPTVIFDLDDTIIDFMGFVCKVYNGKYGESLKKEDMNWRNLNEDSTCTSKKVQETYLEYKNNGIYSALPVFSLVKPTIDMFRIARYKIIFLTARSEEARKDTEICLYSNNIPFDDLIFSTQKEKVIENLSKDHRILLFADDNPDHVKNVVETGKVENCYLVRTSQNKEFDIPGSKTINHISEILSNIYL